MDGTIITNDDLRKLTENIASQLKPCPKCGRPIKVAAVFENNESDDVIGWVQWCPECDNNTYLDILDITELNWKD